jgi:OmpA-OmpF porin, OOP family
MNLIEMLKDQVTGQVLSQVASHIGESEANTKSALGAALPAILGTIANKAGTGGGATDIFNMIKNGGHDGSLLDNLAGNLGGGGISNLLGGGSGIIGSLLGGKAGMIADLIANFSGVKKSSSSSLLSMAAPLLMNVLGKQVTSQGLNAGGLANLLAGQSDFIKKALPASISSAMDLGNLNVGNITNIANDVTKKVVTTVTTSTTAPAAAATAARAAVNTVVEEEKSGLGWLPWLLLPLLALGAWWFMSGKKEVPAPAAVKVEVPAAVAAPVAAAVAAATDGKVKLSSGIELDLPKGGFESKLLSYIMDGTKAVDKTTWFDFDRLYFETGKSVLTKDSDEQLKNLSEIMKAYPQVEVKLGGYTDNVGKPASNVKLSDSRAKAAMASLVAKGIAAARVAAEGYGQENPIADNATAEGRAKNRRVSLRITKK